MTDPTELALRTAIVAEPGRDLPRLVFADFLDERGADGDAALATFIRAGVELARTDEGDPNYPALLAAARRSGVLTAKIRRPWLDSIPGATVSFHRGMIAGVTLPPDVHRKHDPADWARIPVEQLMWSSDTHGGAEQWNDKLGTEMASRPELERVRTLVTDGGAGFLAPLLTNCPNLAGLRSLSLAIGSSVREPDEASLSALAERLMLPALDSFHLIESYRPPVTWRPVVQAVGARLRRLHLGCFYTGDEYRDELRSQARQWFSELGRLPLDHGVYWLDIHDYQSDGFTDDVIQLGDIARAERAVMQTPYQGSRVDLSGRPALRRLHIEIGSDPDDAADVSYLEEAAQLEWLSSNGVYDSKRFASGTKLTSLRRLSLRLVDDEAPILSGAFCPRLYRLDSLGVSPALLSADLLELRWLTTYAGAKLLASLSAASNMPNLCTLVLSDMRDDDKRLKKLLASLAKAPGLPHLSLVGVGRHDRKWWVLGGGKATPVAEGIDPVWYDWWEPDPTDRWF